MRLLRRRAGGAQLALVLALARQLLLHGDTLALNETALLVLDLPHPLPHLLLQGPLRQGRLFLDDKLLAPELALALKQGLQTPRLAHLPFLPFDVHPVGLADTHAIALLGLVVVLGDLTGRAPGFGRRRRHGAGRQHGPGYQCGESHGLPFVVTPLGVPLAAARITEAPFPVIAAAA